MLFKNYSSENWIQYSDKEELDPNNLKKFVKKHSNLYIGFDGCIESLDILVDDFISKTKEEQNEVIKKVEVVSEKFDDNDKKISKVYLTIMKRIIEKGSNFVNEEQRRIENLRSSKISDNKKKELTHKLNILESFKLKDENSIKDEL